MTAKRKREPRSVRLARENAQLQREIAALKAEVARQKADNELLRLREPPPPLKAVPDAPPLLPPPANGLVMGALRVAPAPPPEPDVCRQKDCGGVLKRVAADGPLVWLQCDTCHTTKTTIRAG